MLAGWRELSTRISAILGFLLFFWLLYCHLPKEVLHPVFILICPHPTLLSELLQRVHIFYNIYLEARSTGKELVVGTCEITALDRDISHPKRMIARQTARCACRRGQVAGTTKAKPACVDAQIIVNKQWCGMEPCDEGEQCTLLINRSGWSCTRQLGRIKTVTVS
ncbi:PREDICTED: protein FAM19A5-like isoform X1 [Thamnophis sirtalis]|uniref:Protein FAM19A5-like isoform X1 n=1 Tax=Thamnophis sirtalis TaxID=35019 RepID=A0A6I9XNV1_9SAUR|nr:PREDICTED: protein FAM19A5-like isoform X1 [Thamnophis sirtalis]